MATEVKMNNLNIFNPFTVSEKLVVNAHFVGNGLVVLDSINKSAAYLVKENANNIFPYLQGEQVEFLSILEWVQNNNFVLLQEGVDVGPLLLIGDSGINQTNNYIKFIFNQDLIEAGITKDFIQISRENAPFTSLAVGDIVSVVGNEVSIQLNFGLTQSSSGNYFKFLPNAFKTKLGLSIEYISDEVIGNFTP